MRTKVDLVVLDSLDCLPFNSSGGALLFFLLRKPCACTSVIITTDLRFRKWALVFGNVKSAIALLVRLTHLRHILATGKDRYCFKACSEAAKKPTKKNPRLTMS